MEEAGKSDMVVAILDKLSREKDGGPQSSVNPAARALLQALKDDDPEKLTQSLSDFIRIYENT
jgi:hypothetical protein